jgi:hypothetical protein
MVWIRVQVPVIAATATREAQEPTPLQRAVAAADFGNGISAVMSWDDYVFINPDVAVYMWRPPKGDWIGLIATTSIGSQGTGVAESQLFDQTGRFGRGVQTLLVEGR